MPFFFVDVCAQSLKYNVAYLIYNMSVWESLLLSISAETAVDQSTEINKNNIVEEESNTRQLYVCSSFQRRLEMLCTKKRIRKMQKKIKLKCIK